MDAKVRLWNITTGDNKATLIGHTSNIASIVFSPNGQLLASGGGWDDPTVRLWNPTTGTQTTTLIGQRRRIDSVAFSPDGKILGSVNSDQKICLWDVASGYHQTTLTWNSPENFNLSRIAFSPEGQTLAIGDSGGIRLWNISDKPYKVRWETRTPAISFAYSPDGKTLASGKENGTVILWDAINGTEKATLIGHMDPVSNVAFSPDGKTLVSTGRYKDKTIRFWDVATASHLLTKFTGHTDYISSIAFSPDGTIVASASDDGTILLWEYPLSQRTLGAPTLFTKDANRSALLTPKETSVLQNFPNPFNPETWIPYQLAKPAEVTVRIYNASGILIRTLALGHKPSGIYNRQHNAIYWDGKNEIGEPVSSGVYFYTLSAGQSTMTRRMVIRK